MALKLTYRYTSSLTSGLRCFSSAKKFLDISLNKDTGITTLTMNRPPVNSMNLEFVTELSEIFSELEYEKPKGVILTSFSDRVFSAGLDFSELYKPDRERLATFWSLLQDIMIKLYGSSYLTAAVINGHSPAGGCFLALCCEYRIMVNDFMIGLNETQVGLAVPPWLVIPMQNTIGKRRAEMSLTTGKLFTTKESLEIGLIDETATNKDEAMNKAKAFFERYKMVNSEARAKTKSYLRRPDIEIINKLRKADVENAVFSISQPEVQQSIGRAIAKTKK